jgi:hypothetical protein
MPFYTTILSQRSPTTIYKVDGDNIVLIPAGPFKKDDNHGGYTLFDAINFYTNSKTKEEHIKILRRFVIIYSFLLKDYPIHMFDEGGLTNHIETTSYDNVPINLETGRIKVDFDDMVNHIYHANKPLGKISLSELYKSTNDNYLDFFVLFLDPVAYRGPINYSPDYFIFNRSYLRIVNYITLLEIIIGHADNCEEIISECKVCGKEPYRHRKGSENDWLKKYLSCVVQNSELEKSYFDLINFAKKIRHKTTHDGKLPTSKYILQDTQFEEYGFDRSVKEYKDNDHALFSIVISIGQVTHYLMLNYFYKLTQFFPLKTLKVASFGTPPKSTGA